MLSFVKYGWPYIYVAIACDTFASNKTSEQLQYKIGGINSQCGTHQKSLKFPRCPLPLGFNDTLLVFSIYIKLEL